jgi:hypothetical protein
VASSSDGSKLVAAPQGGDIYRSTDSGATWTPTGNSSLNTLLWLSVASSSDGSKLVAVVQGGDIYMSTDSGATWIPTSDSTLNTLNWYSVTSSSDGTKLVAVVNGGDIYRSTDSGATWTPTNNSSLIKSWFSVASSSDGSKLVAGVYGGDIYKSTDSGATWTPTNNSSLNTLNWTSVASSSDGLKLVAGVYGGGIYTYTALQPPICFLEGSKILCKIDGQESYLPMESVHKDGLDTYVKIEDIHPGDLVKTYLHGYKKVVLIGKGKTQNNGDDIRVKDRLYKYTPENYPELKEDLILTGGHSSLVDELSEEQKQRTTEYWKIFHKTDDKYRLLAVVDDKAIPYEEQGIFNIYHIALEHDNEMSNYGIYANGLLVESCCQNQLKNKKHMKLTR